MYLNLDSPGWDPVTAVTLPLGALNATPFIYASIGLVLPAFFFICAAFVYIYGKLREEAAAAAKPVAAAPIYTTDTQPLSQLGSALSFAKRAFSLPPGLGPAADGKATSFLSTQSFSAPGSGPALVAANAAAGYVNSPPYNSTPRDSSSRNNIPAANAAAIAANRTYSSRADSDFV